MPSTENKNKQKPQPNHVYLETRSAEAKTLGLAEPARTPAPCLLRSHPSMLPHSWAVQILEVAIVIGRLPLDLPSCEIQSECSMSQSARKEISGDPTVVRRVCLLV